MRIHGFSLLLDVLLVHSAGALAVPAVKEERQETDGRRQGDNIRKFKQKSRGHFEELSWLDIRKNSIHYGDYQAYGSVSDLHRASSPSLCGTLDGQIQKTYEISRTISKGFSISTSTLGINFS